jgi:PKD repeat protein
VALDPNFASNGYVYVYYTFQGTDRDRVSRFTARTDNPDVADPASELVILDGILQSAGYHDGGALHFGLDGKLYVAVGDGSISSNAQSLGSLAGKLLRIDPSSFPNIVPPDNPFVGTSGARGEVWALGLRNPFTFAVEPGTGRIHINDVGENRWEEINVGSRGANYGWPTCEGSCSNAGFVNPIYAYSHGGGQAAITGGTFYRANHFPPEYSGSYFFADYVNGFIRRLTSGNVAVEFAPSVNTPVDLDVGPDGGLYYLSIFNGAVYTIRYVGAGNRNPVAVASAAPTSGQPPLEVRFSGVGSSDPDGDVLNYSWQFGDGSPAQPGAQVTHVYSSPGRFTAALTVDDQKGGTSTATVTITVGTPPAGVITQPPEGTRYNAGQTIYFEGTATDAEDGNLPASAFSWTIRLHHLDHSHSFLGPLAGIRSGSFTIPRTGETSAQVWYRIYLTVTDSTGLTHPSTRDVSPNTSTLTLATEPPGLQLTLEGQPMTAPQSVVGVVGMMRTLGAPSPQVVGGQRYEFVSWSDGGAATHGIETPGTATTYTATFRAIGSEAAQAVVWRDLVNAVVSGSTLQQNGCCRGGAVSSQSIASGDGYMEFTIVEVPTQRSAGLSNGNTDVSDADIDFAVHLNGTGSAEVRENEVYKRDTPYASGDVFRVAVVGGLVRYSRNGVVFYTSAKAPTYPLLVDVSLGSPGSTIANAIIAGAGGGADTTPPLISGVTAGAVTATSATITWTTDEPADSQVEYGLTTAYGNATTRDLALVTSHAQALTGLSRATLYHYRVRSRDAAGNLAVSGDFTLTTLAGSDVDAGLVGYWRLDEGSGTMAGDASGNGGTGSLLNGPAWTVGRPGQALAFDGIDDRVDVPHSTALNSYPLTVAVWVKTSAVAGVRGIVNKYLAGSYNGYQVFLNNGTLCAWYLRDTTSYIYDGTGCTLGTAGYTDGQWHHVVFVVDAAGGQLYVDGVPRASQPWTGLPGPPATVQDLHLGHYPGAYGGAEYFPGVLDEVRIYNRALSAEEVASLYQQ